MFLLEDAAASTDRPPEVIGAFQVVGRLPFVAEEKLLRMRFRGRDAAFGDSLERACGLVAAAWNGDALGSVTALRQGAPIAGGQPAAGPAGPEPAADRRRWSVRQKGA